MSIKNTSLGGTDWSTPTARVKPTDLNDTFSAGASLTISSLAINGLNTIRSLIDRVGVWSAGNIDGWGDAYINANGRENSVDTANTTAPFITDSYCSGFISITGDTTHNPNTYTTPENAFDDDLATYAEHAGPYVQPYQSSLGKTFASKYIGVGFVKARVWTSGDAYGTYYIQTYKSSTWTTIKTVNAYDNYGRHNIKEFYFTVDDTVEGIRIVMYTNGVTTTMWHIHYVYELKYGNVGASKIITHNIPTGKLSGTCSSVIGVPFINNFKTNSVIKYKLTNATEDSGWLDCGNAPSVSQFTPFTSEPTKLIVSLIPSGATFDAFSPTIKGFWVKEL
ncbi:MAG: hypothetical protein K0A90_00100 [Methanosarcinaceae archaeon]|nr:hypothetical protein [Methanosarcinaceae archaeon]